MQLSTEAAGFGRQEKEMLNLFGGQDPLLAHHRPSGKLILATGKGFADKLFSPKPGLAKDPVFQKTMKDLPMEGTGLSYFSPATFRILREVFEKANDLENPKEKEYKQDDRLMATTLINLFLPKNARGEGSVTTNTKDGLLSVSNSAHSQKSSLLMGGVAPVLLVPWMTFSSVREEAPADRAPDVHIHTTPDIGPGQLRPPPGGFEREGD